MGSTLLTPAAPSWVALATVTKMQPPTTVRTERHFGTDSRSSPRAAEYAIVKTGIESCITEVMKAEVSLKPHTKPSALTKLSAPSTWIVRRCSGRGSIHPCLINAPATISTLAMSWRQSSSTPGSPPVSSALTYTLPSTT